MKIVRILIFAIIVLGLFNYFIIGKFKSEDNIALAVSNVNIHPLSEINPVEKNELVEVVKEGQMRESILLDVPFINQMSAPRLYNGCEVTSLAMMLNYHGIEVTKNELAERTPTVPLKYKDGKRGNPNEGFVGDVINGPGLSVYHGPIAELAKKYSDKVEDLSGKDISEIYNKVGNGLPVWIITTTNLSPVNSFETWDTPQGEISVTFNVHSVVVTGYDEEHVYVNDPYGTKNRKVDRDNFEKAWEQMGSQAVVINK